MTYLVDLILVMHILFSVAQDSSKDPISRRLVKRVVGDYKNSTTKAEVHFTITEYVQGIGAFNGIDRDNALDTVTALIKRHSRAPDLLKLQNKIVSCHFPANDEPWDILAPANPSSV